MTAWRKVQGDVDDTITVVLNGVEDLTTVTSVVAHVWHGQATPINLSAAVTVWFLELQVTFGNGAVLTWPSGRPDTISVRADV
jgi:hypothetical protein